MDETIPLFIAAADCEAFVLCAALGTLEAIQRGSWPAEAGIWTLGRPNFWGPLEGTGVPEEVLAVFRGADELDSLEELGGRELMERKLAKSIAVLHARLAAVTERFWYARWSDPKDDEAERST